MNAARPKVQSSIKAKAAKVHNQGGSLASSKLN